MSKFLVEDTYNGYRLTLLDGHGNVRHQYGEVGGHGPVEKLFALAEQTWNELRTKDVNPQRHGRSHQLDQYVLDIVDWFDGEREDLPNLMDYSLLSEEDRKLAMIKARQRIQARATHGHARI